MIWSLSVQNLPSLIIQRIKFKIMEFKKIFQSLKTSEAVVLNKRHKSCLFHTEFIGIRLFSIDVRSQLKGAFFDEKIFNRLFQRAPGDMGAAVFF